MTIPFDKARLLANPKAKAKSYALAPEFEIAAELLRTRLRAGFSPAELAARTSQSAVARLEGGHALPSTKTILRYAEATAIGGLTRFVPMMVMFSTRRALHQKLISSTRST